MPLTRLIADAFGVVTICLVSALVLLGLLCILYSVYFRHQIRKQDYIQLGYFNKPWIIRIVFVLFAIWWGFGEIVRLSLLRRSEGVVHAFDPKWQEGVCKFYVVSNLGFAEPCLFLTILFLLRASFRQREFGVPCKKWNGKTACYILLCCLPNFVYQLIVVSTGDRLDDKIKAWKLPHYFTRTSVSSVTGNNVNIALCAYPLLSTMFLGLYAALITLYLLFLGRKLVSSVINKGLQRRVFFLIFFISSFFPLRVVLLGLSVLSQPGQFLFEALVFTAFLGLLCCAGLAICMLVYCPVADSLALSGIHDSETGGRPFGDHHDEVSLIVNQSLLEASSTTSTERHSDESTKRGSVSFRIMLKDEPSSDVYEELSLLSPSTHHLGSAPLPNQSMLS